MFWTDVDKAIPAYSEQIVKMKVADLSGNYAAVGWYDHKREEWFNIDGLNLHDNVYAWKHIRGSRRISREEREALIASWD